jgi:hypothetical protein
VRVLAAQADVLHLEQLETAWCANGTTLPTVIHLHYRVQMDRRPPAPWRKDFRFFAERVLAERVVSRRQPHLVASSPLVADRYGGGTRGPTWSSSRCASPRSTTRRRRSRIRR